MAISPFFLCNGDHKQFSVGVEKRAAVRIHSPCRPRRVEKLVLDQKPLTSPSGEIILPSAMMISPNFKNFSIIEEETRAVSSATRQKTRSSSESLFVSLLEVPLRHFVVNVICSTM